MESLVFDNIDKITIPAAENTHQIDFDVDTSIVDVSEIEVPNTYPLGKIVGSKGMFQLMTMGD